MINLGYSFSDSHHTVVGRTPFASDRRTVIELPQDVYYTGYYYYYRTGPPAPLFFGDKEAMGGSICSWPLCIWRQGTPHGLRRWR